MGAPDSEVGRTGLTRGCAEVQIVERVALHRGRREGGGDAAIQVDRAGAAVARADRGLRGGDADIPLLSPADPPQGKKLARLKQDSEIMK